MAISNLHWQPYYIFMNPFGVDFLLYLHFIRIEQRMNINFFQNFLSLGTCNHIQRRICQKSKTHSQSIAPLYQENSFGTALMDICRMRQQMHWLTILEFSMSKLFKNTKCQNSKQVNAMNTFWRLLQGDFCHSEGKKKHCLFLTSPESSNLNCKKQI